MPESTEEMPKATSFQYWNRQYTQKKRRVWHSVLTTNACMLHIKPMASC